jgi:hypothetical protein
VEANVNSPETSPNPIRDMVARVRAEAERAAAARHDPVIQASIAQDEGNRVERVPELERQERERRWEARGIAKRLWPMLHDGAPGGPVGPLAPQPTQALEVVGRFLSAADSKTGLVLAGDPGTGKTVAANWGAAWHPGARVVKALDLVRAGLYPDDHGFWPRMHDARLLVVDDLAAEPLDAKGFSLATICDLIDRRYDSARKTIITTNQSLEEFRQRYGTGAGARLWRRLVEVYRFVELTDPAPRAGGR